MFIYPKKCNYKTILPIFCYCFDNKHTVQVCQSQMSNAISNVISIYHICMEMEKEHIFISSITSVTMLPIYLKLYLCFQWQKNLFSTYISNKFFAS